MSVPEDQLAQQLEEQQAADARDASSKQTALITPALIAQLLRAAKWAREKLLELDARPQVNVVPLSELPERAPAGTLWRTTQSGDLYLGNGPNQPLSRFPAA
jgi:hypothetical protein